MKIAFFFPSNFNILTAFVQPIGGSESAVTYLALELVKLGHEVSLVTLTPKGFQGMGVNCYSMGLKDGNLQLPKEVINPEHDVYIIKNGIPELGHILKNTPGLKAKVYFWTGHADDQPAIQGLAQENVSEGFDKILCVSDWQKERFVGKFNIQPDKIGVHRNAISPFFENLFVNEEEMEEQKSVKPHLVYTSTPFRGLDVLLNQYNPLCEAVSDLHLSVYSSMKVYGVEKDKDQFQHLYETAIKHPAIDYVGSIPQIQLAGALRSKHILAYPNTFPETSCIAVMEAMAAGLKVITTNLGALPETTLGLGELIEPENLISNEKNGFSAAIETQCKKIHTAKHIEAMYQQVMVMNQEHTWRVRAREWESLFIEQSDANNAVA